MIISRFFFNFKQEFKHLEMHSDSIQASSKAVAMGKKAGLLFGSCDF